MYAYVLSEGLEGGWAP